MEYQNITNLLDNKPDKPSKFRTKNWVEINNNSHGMYSLNRTYNLKLDLKL